MHGVHLEGERSEVLAVNEVICLLPPYLGWLSTRGKCFFMSVVEVSGACAWRFKQFPIMWKIREILAKLLLLEASVGIQLEL